MFKTKRHQKKTGADLDGLIEQVLAAAPRRKDSMGPWREVHELARRRNDLLQRLKEVREKLSKCTYSDSVSPTSAIRYDPGSDAQHLADGGSIDELAAPAEESNVTTLRRQFRALEIAPDRVQQQIRDLEFQVAQAEYNRLRPMLAEVVRESADRYESLRTGLTALQQLVEELHRRGLPHIWLGDLFCGFDQHALHGFGGYGTLEFQIEERKKAWNLNAEKGADK